MRDVVSPVLTAGAPTPLGSFPLLGKPEALEALAAAAAAWGKGRGVWPTITVAARIDCVERFVSSMIAVRESVVETLVWEIGKSRPDSEKEFDRTVAYVRDTIAAVKEIDRAGSRFQQVEGIVAQVRRAPLGVTPLPEPDAPERMAALVADAEAKGAQVLNARAGRLDATTFFPAVVGPVTKGMRLWHKGAVRASRADRGLRRPRGAPRLGA